MNLGAGSVIESIEVGRPSPLQKSADTIYDQEIQAASIHKTEVPDQLVVFDMWTNDTVQETKVDFSVLDGPKDSKKGNH